MHKKAVFPVPMPTQLRRPAQNAGLHLWCKFQRRALRLRAPKVAKWLGCTTAAVYLVEAGKASFGLTVRCARALKVPPEPIQYAAHQEARRAIRDIYQQASMRAPPLFSGTRLVA